MINKDLMELQIGCKATCAVILREDLNELNSKIVINANVSESELIDIVKEDVSRVNYFVITEIDKANIDIQDKYYHIVKDREISGKQIPENVVFVFTVKDKESLKNISKELYHLCVVVF